MHDGDRKLARLAATIQNAWRQQHSANLTALPTLPQEIRDRVTRLHGLLAQAIGMQKPLAAARLRRELSDMIGGRIQQLYQLRDRLTPAAEITPAADDVFQDLRALEREFPLVSCLPTRGLLSATTEPIELQHVRLGAFRIELSWNVSPVPSGVPAAPLFEFDVVAVDPHPAGTDDSHPHPHVDGTTLCVGDGRRPIQLALKQLRLFDFFELVRQILTTYNPGSAYVALEDWDSVECRDCGDQVRSSTARSCDDCCGTVCEDCVSVCRDCGERFCADCSYRCADCDEETCSTCLGPCRGCGEKFCRRCLTDDNCFTCDEKQEANEAGAAQEAHQSTDREQKVESPCASSGESTGAAANTAVHAVCVE